MAPVALVVGYGSIGARHARLLRQLGCRTAVVSRQPADTLPVDNGPYYPSVEEAIAAERPSYVVVANETSRHLSTLTALADAGYEGTVLVEKPLFDRSRAVPDQRFAAAFVGYDKRFHPVLGALRARLSDQRAISAQVYVGQYLPDWRPGTDYRTGYSAHAALGGGVLRDLSHEFDYLGWLFGPWRRIAAVGGRLGSLEIDSDDCWAVLMSFARCPMATVQLNYLDRAGRREIIVNTEAHTYRADLAGGRLDCDGVVEDFAVDRDATFVAEHEAALATDDRVLCSLAEGLSVVDTVEAVEQAARDGRWVER